MSLKLYFLRHGQTDRSRDNVFCGSIDPDLTPDGLEMAKAFAVTYRSLPWNAIFCSPMRRTVATAKPLCEAVGMQMELRDGLKEINYGKWEGKTIETVDREYHDDYIRWTADPAWYPPTEGELAVAIAHRSLQVIEEIKQRFNNGNVLIVAHKATIRIMLCSLLGIDVGRFRFRLGCPVGSVSIVEFGAHGPLLHALSDRIHLDERLRTLPGT
ncbi:MULTISPECIES: histidine phosphatase family protein [unclassified Coleofasciculus]|uniref:histidine phosphatase family protein n=1 Tax=Cyanophyceae TaxID=3028117 RepID=UPI0016867E72|nr:MULTISPECIES: histidine phosphatase family protein [unclassified Coleofasciculus]MBD1891905.1 histidine phosphatase family protein [Coleofasciculus sp. FACHB-SPT9]MBD2538454.1 histidine phosphatase family protein [Coleofasciculus sp. FACHB-SPT36]